MRYKTKSRKKYIPPIYKPRKDYADFFRRKSKPIFKNIEEVKLYLEKEVFSNPDFIRNVVSAGKKNEVSYLLAYDVITKTLINILYEIDNSITLRRKKKRINVYGYFYLEIGFMISLKGKKMFLEKYIKI